MSTLLTYPTAVHYDSKHMHRFLTFLPNLMCWQLPALTIPLLGIHAIQHIRKVQTQSGGILTQFLQFIHCCSMTDFSYMHACYHHLQSADDLSRVHLAPSLFFLDKYSLVIFLKVLLTSEGTSFASIPTSNKWSLIKFLRTICIISLYPTSSHVSCQSTNLTERVLQHFQFSSQFVLFTCTHSFIFNVFTGVFLHQNLIENSQAQAISRYSLLAQSSPP